MTSPGPGQEELVDALVRSSFAVMAVLSRIGAEHDLSLTQLRMLGILRDRRVTMRCYHVRPRGTWAQR